MESFIDFRLWGLTENVFISRLRFRAKLRVDRICSSFPFRRKATESYISLISQIELISVFITIVNEGLRK